VSQGPISRSSRCRVVNGITNERFLPVPAVRYRLGIVFSFQRSRTHSRHTLEQLLTFCDGVATERLLGAVSADWWQIRSRRAAHGQQGPVPGRRTKVCRAANVGQVAHLYPVYPGDWRNDQFRSPSSRAQSPRSRGAANRSVSKFRKAAGYKRLRTHPRGRALRVLALRFFGPVLRTAWKLRSTWKKNTRHTCESSTICGSSTLTARAPIRHARPTGHTARPAGEREASSAFTTADIQRWMTLGQKYGVLNGSAKLSQVYHPVSG
jgi:hypothetical protein